MNLKENIISGDHIKLLCFEILLQEEKKIQLALNIQKILEIVQSTSLYPIQSSFYPIIGNLDYVNQPIPVIFLGHYFDCKFTKLNCKSRIIICEFQKTKIGILVDHTKRIITIKNEELLPNPVTINNAELNLYNGLIKYHEEFLYLLDIEQLLLQLNFVPNSMKESPSSFVSDEMLLNSFHGKKALIVEDSKLFQKKMIQTLQKLKIEFIMADDGMMGYELYEKNHEKIDIIFTDIEMPKLNGIGMIRRIRKLPFFKPIPVIFNTSISNPALINDIHQEKLGTYCIKFDEMEIRDVLKKSFP